MLGEVRHIKSGKPQLREFGATMAAALIVLGDIALLRGRASAPYLLGSGVVFGAAGLAFPQALRPLQKAWMALGIVLGFFVSRVVLGALFYGVVTPIGLVMKLMGKDVLDERIDRGRPSYWHERAPEARPKTSYENQY
jgi:polyferredoxin